MFRYQKNQQRKICFFYQRSSSQSAAWGPSISFEFIIFCHIKNLSPSFIKNLLQFSQCHVIDRQSLPQLTFISIGNLAKNAFMHVSIQLNSFISNFSPKTKTRLRYNQAVPFNDKLYFFEQSLRYKLMLLADKKNVYRRELVESIFVT